MFFPFAIFAESRWMPWWSVYFTTQTINSTQQWDKMWDKLNGSIHQLAKWNHAKSMAIRAFLYEYCWEQARLYMQDTDIDGRWLKVYQQYNFLQTQLYQSLQPTVQKIRVILDDKNISFPIILSHLQSNDGYLLYFYGTIPQRYIDTVFFADMDEVRTWLRRYKTANDSYPITLSELILYKYIPSSISLSTKKIIYRAYNLPDIILYKKYPPHIFKALEPTYILLYQAQFADNIEYVSTIETLRNKVRTYDFETRISIKKTPSHTIWKGVWWKIDFPEYY